MAGGTPRLVTGLVFKTSRTEARVVVGGFDSHVPPPIVLEEILVIKTVDLFL